MEYLVQFFNALLDHNIYPDSWAESVILPLFGKCMRRVTKMIEPTTEGYLYTYQ